MTFKVFPIVASIVTLTSACAANPQVQEMAIAASDSQPNKPAYDFSPVSKTIQQWVDKTYYHGAALLVCENHRIVYEHYFGDAKPESVVYLASAGKWLAAATIAAVVDEGRLSWDDPASKWLPELTDAKGRATLRQLLSHTAGYPDYQPKGEPVDAYQTLAESVKHIAPLPAGTEPGALFHYGGLAMQVAGRMAELATGKEWETIFQEKIAQPLEMKDTHFTPVDDKQGGHAPMLGGGARGTLHDYANFLEMIDNGGEFRGRRILSADSIREMQADQVRTAKVEPGKEFVERARGAKHAGIYGLGEWREELNDEGAAVLLSSPSWAGTYPWIDKTSNVYGVFLTHVSGAAAGRDHFSSFYSSPVLPMMVRDVVEKGAASILSAAALAGKSVAPSFVEIGKSYILRSLPVGDAVIPLYFNDRVTVKASGGGDWFRIEYEIHSYKQPDGTVVPSKKRQVWLNFAQVLAVEEVD